ncbi:amidase [Paenibacillus algicola]|uniref:Amidase n=1 Tax=Paenibacillus algicola TaxID=2565926 RepID=A0A4V1G3F6_9BACL|nr:amidase family protein [Paenibacillus algicola]QCT01024.1 amidase [Paenibacillus algicola]
MKKTLFKNKLYMTAALSLSLSLSISAISMPLTAQAASASVVDDSWVVNYTKAPTGLDTGSVRSTDSRALMGFGGIRMHVIGSDNLLDGVLLRGFGLTFDGVDTYSSTNAVTIDGVAVKREIKLDKSNNSGRFFDTFTNTTNKTIYVEVAFGGQLGYNTSTNQSAISTTSSGDATIDNTDHWVSFYTPSDGEGSASFNGPSATTIGTGGFVGSLNRTGNFLRDPFTNPLERTGDEANHYGLIYSLELPPQQTRSLAHFVVTGQSEVSAELAAGSQVKLVQTVAEELSEHPDFSDLPTGAVCSLSNYDLDALVTASVIDADCDNTDITLPGAATNPVTTPIVSTTSLYDVTGKTITELLADMESGKTNAQQVTKAYIDRIAAYDEGPLGLNSVIMIAPDAMQQAIEADLARANGDTRPLLGIPILVKDIIDTKNMPTTGGSDLFRDYQSPEDAWQVAKLREAGAIIFGKANLAEFARDGHFSFSAFGPVWNAFDPSRSSIGSSGGSAVAVASSFAAAALGTQTGDSLWGPSGAASLFSLRGTDGMQSTAGTMPLTIIQDYTGMIARSLPDLALLLEATAIGNPNDPYDDVSDGHRPTDWQSFLREDALEGKVIGVPAGAFDDPFGTSGTSDAMRAQFVHFVEAGATIKEISAPPKAPTRDFTGDTRYEGWSQWIEAHPDNPYTDPTQIMNPTSTYTGAGAMTEEALQAFENYRANYRELLHNWMDEEGVDVLLFPTELSDIHLNDSIQPSFGRLDPQSSASGVPTVIFPAGVNDHDQPIGFQLQGKAYSDGDLMGYAYAYTAQSNGHVQSSLTPSLTPLPELAAFTDISNHWAVQYISDLVADGVVKGTSVTEFSPSQAMTRGMFVTLLGRMNQVSDEDGSTSFTDVNSSAYYAPYVKWAEQAGIVAGFADGTFAPGKMISRQNAAVMINRYLSYKGITVSGSQEAVGFADHSDIAAYAADAVQTVQKLGIMSGMPNNRFAPTGNILRSETAKIISIVLDLEQ